MPVVRKSALVPHSAVEMFNLVNDFQSYPQFLPWCRSSKVISQNEGELCGELEVARAGIRQSFSTCNQLFPYETIKISLKEGPFKELRGSWNFTPLRADACKVELELEFGRITFFRQKAKKTEVRTMSG